MRAALVLALILLSVPAALWSQDHASQYKDVISWGPNKQTFQVTLTGRGAEGIFMVSEQGFRWFLVGGVETGTGPLPWGDIRTWSCSRQNVLMLDNAVIGLKHEDLLKVVNQYLKKFAPAALDTAHGCAPEKY